MAKKKVPTQKIHVDAIDPDKMKSEGPLNYEMICKLMGELYLESYRRTSSVEDHARSLVDRLNQEMDVLRSENRKLREQIEDTKSGPQ
tara:strand:- start:846 stop:1109 length:264 start_codon:yes stop_codon:yes gene_type:complete